MIKKDESEKKEQGNEKKEARRGSVVIEKNEVITDYEIVEPQESQMSLFILDNKEDRNYSHLVELYDMIPRVLNAKAIRRIDGKFLPAFTRQFTYNNIRYDLTIKPARVVKKDKSGNVISEREHYPTTREELVEDALRKLAVEGSGRFIRGDENGDDEEAGVVFTLYALQQELASVGHKYSINEIKEAISVCSSSIIEIRSADGQDIISSPIFPTIGLTTRENWQEMGKKSRGFVRFNPLVSRSIKNKTFRQFSYKTSMKFRFSLSRYLHKRMSYMYRQASRWDEPYKIRLLTLIEDSGMTRYEKLPNNNREVKKTLEELKEKNVIAEYEVQTRHEDKSDPRILTDALYVLTPHADFVSDMIRFNAKFAEMEGKKESIREIHHKQKEKSEKKKGK